MAKEKSEKDGKLIIIDGNSLMHRAFYGLPLLSNSKGLHTNVIYGFINMINKLIDEFKPKYISIAFDMKSPTFRHTEYAEYKAGRKKMADEMAEQIPVLKQVLDAMRIKRLEIDGYEADDIIGTIASKADALSIQTFIVTGDRDAFQLISDNVHVLFTKKGISDMEEYDGPKLMEAYSIKPSQVTDMKGLMGDASDNIPGVPGIGEKTALDLIKQFSSLESVLERSSEISKKGVREKIEANKEQAIFSKRLATIVTDVPLDICLDNCEVSEPDFLKLRELYEGLEFRSLLDKLNIDSPALKPEIQIKYTELKASSDIKQVIDGINSKGSMSFKISGDEIYIASDDEVVCFNIGESTLPYIRSMMESEQIHKAGYDIKQDILFLKHRGIDLKNVSFDTILAAYLINPSKTSYTIRELAYEFLNMNIDDEKYDVAYIIEKLVPVLKERLRESEMEQLYYDVELPLTEALADMEYLGFKVDSTILKELSLAFGERIDGLTEGIYLLAGESFNINSPKQLGVILFEKLLLPVVKKTKTGYSTDVEVLEALSSKHPLPEKILEYRQLVKLKSTYVDGLMGLINQETGRIHSKLNQTVTATGRLSSTEPNLQNIPIKTEEGRQIRRAFVPENENFVLMDADYSQIELRVLAHISNDDILIDAFKNNEDIHTRTASEVFGVPKTQVTSLMRSRAKAVNFGIVYGLSDFGLAKDLGITRKEAKQYIENYFKRYPDVKKYMEDIVAQAKEKGYVTTMLKRRRYIPEIASKNAVVRNMGERIAMNTPIQGSAADIIKIAMIKVYKELKDRNLRSRLILQVHDELIVETHKDEMEEVKEIIKASMEKAVDMRVPLTAEVHCGKSWYDSK